MRWRKSKEPSRGSSDLTAFIDEGSEIEGKYNFSGTVMLNGKFSGEIVSNDSLIIGEKGVVNATVRAGVVLINGEVIGNVFATERVELRGTARVYGDVEAPVIVVEEGVRFEGRCKNTKERSADATADDRDALSFKR
jgi:cytoskeletal protein CcmA (bactofilin family)